METGPKFVVEVPVDLPVVAGEKKPNRPGTFVSGDSRAYRGGRAARGEIKDDFQYRDMKWVYNHPEGPDKTAGRKKCRQWLEEDLKGFMKVMGQLRAARKADKKEVEGGPAKVDEGSERCLQALRSFRNHMKQFEHPEETVDGDGGVNEYSGR